MDRSHGVRWSWSAECVALAVMSVGCLSTNPAGLYPPKHEAQPAKAASIPVYNPRTPPQVPPAPAPAPVPAPAAPAPSPAPAPRVTPAPREQGAAGQGFFVYELKKGDTLYSLSRRYGVTVQQLEQDNAISDPSDLPIGKKIYVRRVPGAEAPQAAGSGSPAAEAPAGQRRPVAASELNRGRPGSAYWWPTGGTLTRRFSEEFRGMADPGIAISAPAGTEVYAVADGTVVSVVLGGNNAQSVWGNVVSISHAGEVTSWYGHLGQVLVKEGARVSRGEAIGTVGTTGAVSAPALAFRIYRDNRPVNPLSLLP
jgi:LysM repeat protein